MDKELLRLPSDPNSEPFSTPSGTPGMSFQNSPPTGYHVGDTSVNNRIGPTSPNTTTTTAYTQFLPTSSTGHSLPPPPGLPPPGLSNIYQYPSHPYFVPAPEMPGVPVPGHPYMAGPGPFQNNPNFKSAADGQYLNGYINTSGGTVVPTFPEYQYFGNMQQQQQHQPVHHVIPGDNSMNISQQGSYGQYNNAPYEHVAYQRSSGSDFSGGEQLKMDIGPRSKRNLGQGVYDDVMVKDPSEYLLPPQVNVTQQSMFNPSNVASEVNSNVSSNKTQSNNSISNGVGRVMNPIIENLVGSMSMCNGTYTHFGPSAAPTNNGLNGHSRLLEETVLPSSQTVKVEADKMAFSKATVAPSISPTSKAFENLAAMNSFNMNETAKQASLVSEPDVSETKVTLTKTNLNMAANAELDHQRSASPKEATESTSRPQTPGKPSYLEVLTKAGISGIKNPANSPTRKTSSTSSSPVQSSFAANNEGAPNLVTHRKSVDIFTGSVSTPSSSCPSSSSSPATKRNSITGLFSKGKENVSSNNIKKQTSLDKGSPSNSPAHQNIQNSQQYPSKGKMNQGFSNSTSTEDRKILTSQNSSSLKGAKATNNSKSGKNSIEKLNQFDELKDNGEWGWKTYTSRSRNNNVSNIGNRNSLKRTSASNNGQSNEILGSANFKNLEDEDDDDSDVRKSGGSEDQVLEKKSGSSSFASATASGGSGASHSRKREKEKSRSRKEGRNCVSRRLESLVYMWLTHLISALTWLWSLITDVASLSASLGVSLLQDFYTWTKTKALPNVNEVISRWRRAVWQTGQDVWGNSIAKLATIFSRGGGAKNAQENNSSTPGLEGDENILTLLGPDRNIMLPANGDEALKRLLSVKGQDPYSILGVRSDSSEETIRRYYKRQAVLVHPDKNLIVGAEEAFKILARAFELVGDPVKRTEYHQKLMEAQAKEKFCGEIGNLLEQLRKKMEAASSTIRCTKCNSRHKKNLTDRPLFAARYCSQCRIHHGAREGELWAERKGWFGVAWNYFACMDGHVWEINEWARCQKANLKHIKADAHCVMYRLVAGGGNHNQNNGGQHCHGNGASFEDGAGSEADEWDSLINNLYKSPTGSSYGKATGAAGKPGCCGGSSTLNNNGNNPTNQSAGRKRKGKRNK